MSTIKEVLKSAQDLEKISNRLKALKEELSGIDTRKAELEQAISTAETEEKKARKDFKDTAKDLVVT